MIFTSPLFLFIFLPLAWGAWMVLGRLTRGSEASLATLIAASIVFYGWWHLPNLTLLACSVVANYALGYWMARSARPARTWMLWTGVSGNLALLGVYKYYGFFTGERVALVLPLAISFFTFTQIAFLVDVSRNEVQEKSFLRYGFFVVFFPHLIAGPIVRLQEIQGQLSGCVPRRLTYPDFQAGTTLILIGLAKKILIADTLSPSSDLLFSAASAGSVNASAAWIGASCFYLQIYFDFSGYSDIAIGLARLFLIRFPENFNVPYSATSLIEFWRRWHMTLSRFLRDYLYIPLGGSRKGLARQRLNVMVTMLLGGLWHGAGWTFVVWGGVHGVGLVLNHAFRAAFPRLRVPVIVKLVAVQGFVFIAWIFFRARDFRSALGIIRAMPGAWSLNDSVVRAMTTPAQAMIRLLLGKPSLDVGFLGLGALIAIAFVASVWRTPAVPAWLGETPSLWAAGGLRVLLAALVLVVLVGRVRSGYVIEPFIYFQF